MWEAFGGLVVFLAFLSFLLRGWLRQIKCPACGSRNINCRQASYRVGNIVGDQCHTTTLECRSCGKIHVRTEDPWMDERAVMIWREDKN